MSLHFDSFELDYLQPLSFHANNDTALDTHSARRSSDSDSRSCYASVADDESIVEPPLSPFLDSHDLVALVSPSPAPSSASCGSSGDSLYDSDELSSLPSAAAYNHSQPQHYQHHSTRDPYQMLPVEHPYSEGEEVRVRLLAELEERSGESALVDKHRSEYDREGASQQSPLLHPSSHPHDGGLYGLYESTYERAEYGGTDDVDVDMELEMEAEDGECEYSEEETATPALAAVPPAEIVQATVADPSFVLNPAFAKLSNNHTKPAPSTHLAPAHTATSASSVEQEQSGPLPYSPSRAAAVSPTTTEVTPAVKPKRKYTKRAKSASTPEPAHTATSVSSHNNCDVPPLDSVQPQPTACPTEAPLAIASNTPLTASTQSSAPSVTTVAAVAGVLGAGCTDLTAVSTRARSASSEDVDDNASIISAHSQHSAQSALSLHDTASSDTNSDVSTTGLSSSELVVTVASPSASPSSSPASSPRSVVSSTCTTASSVARPSLSFSLASLPTLPPPGKPGRKRKNAVPPASSAVVSGDSADGSSRADASDGSSDTVSADGTPVTVEVKKLVRLQRNRASAQLSRERKKRYMGELEERMKQLMDVNYALESQLSTLAVENAELKKRLGDETAITPAVAVKKRAKLSRSDSKHSKSSGATVVTGTGRTALLMFGIFISFALFYNLVGIDFHADSESQLLVPSGSSRSNSPTYTPPFPGRLLQSLRENSNLLPEDVTARVKKEPLAIEPPPTPVPQPQQQPQSLALVTVDSSADNRALVIADEHSKDAAETSAEVKGQHKLYEPFAPYRTHNVTSDSTVARAAGEDVRSQYVLCADATAIQPLVVDAGSGEKRRAAGSLNEDEEMSRTAKRLRKSLGLPAPASSAPASSAPSALAFANVEHADTAPSSKVALHKDDQLLLWLPSAQLQLDAHTPPQPHERNTSATAAPSSVAVADSDMVQVRCQVQSLSYVSRA